MAIYPKAAKIDDQRVGITRDAPADPYTVYRANKDRINAHWYDIRDAFKMKGIQRLEWFERGKGADDKAQRIYTDLSAGFHPLAQITYRSSLDNTDHTHWVIFLDYTGTDLVPSVLPNAEPAPIFQDPATFNPEDPDTMSRPVVSAPPADGIGPPRIGLPIEPPVISGGDTTLSGTASAYSAPVDGSREEKFVIHDPGWGAYGKDVLFSQNRTEQPLDSITELVTYFP